MEMAGSKFLFFSPYASWKYHTALEATWAHGLRQRGAEAQFVLCDELLPACDIHRLTVNPRGLLSCRRCKQRAAQQLESYEAPHAWLGSWLPPRARREVASWVKQLDSGDLLQAHWKGRPVGRWASTSVYYQLRTSIIDPLDPSQAKLLRQHLQGIVLVFEALTVLYREVQPDTVVMLNGRFFTHWAAFELARERGIRVVTHERGLNKNTVRLAENHRTHELAPMHALWEAWKDVPLDASGLASVQRVLRNRALGIDYSVRAFSPPLEPRGATVPLRQQLGLDSRPLVAVFTSSDDETAAFSDRCQGAFPNATDFLPATLELARGMPQVQFVVRIHPNVQSKLGTNQAQLKEALAARRAAPENLRVVLPDEPLSSYALVEEAEVGVVYATTLGLEMACNGQQVLCMAQSTYRHVGCTRNLERPEEYREELLRALHAGKDTEVARRALRWSRVYFQHFAMPFPLVEELPGFEARPTYANLETLRPGVDPGLDEIVGRLLGERPMIPQPTPARRCSSPLEEDRFLANWVQVSLHAPGPA